jgi:hypothetical protein
VDPPTWDCTFGSSDPVPPEGAVTVGDGAAGKFVSGSGAGATFGAGGSWGVDGTVVVGTVGVCTGSVGKLGVVVVGTEGS